jgi:CheY-like chemotaxis protein
MSYVLAIEPDQAQAEILRDDVSTRAKAPVTVVNSLDAAMSAIDRAVPDLLLVSALMPSSDERLLLDRLRDFVEGPAPQVLVIPALARADDPQLMRRSLFSRRRGRPLLPVPCHPHTFADDLAAYLPDERPRDSRLRRRPVRLAADERREAARFERIDLARVLIDGDAVDLIDVSLTGAQVVAVRVLRPGASVHVLLARQSDAICCDADVVWGGIDLVGSAQELSYRAGIRFSQPDRAALKRLYFGSHRVSSSPATL